MIDVRLRHRLSPDALRDMRGKCLGPADYDLMLTGPTRVRKPDGRPLAVYLPGALTAQLGADTRAILHEMTTNPDNHPKSRNRGDASGSRRIRRGDPDGIKAGRTESLPVTSMIVGSVDPMGQKIHCRTTAWTGRHLDEWATLHPLLRTVADRLAEHVPDRYAAQLAAATISHPDWIIPGTPFSTVTVNNSYPTGVHVDKGDLDAGFSSIAVVRNGEYRGGQLVFPEWRCAVDLGDGDLILMDAHDWHGNVPIVCDCGARLNGPCRDCDAERISLVSYFRTKIAGCGSAQAEQDKALDAVEAKLSGERIRAGR